MKEKHKDLEKNFFYISFVLLLVIAAIFFSKVSSDRDFYCGKIKQLEAEGLISGCED